MANFSRFHEQDIHHTMLLHTNHVTLLIKKYFGVHRHTAAVNSFEFNGFVLLSDAKNQRHSIVRIETIS